MWRSAWFQFLVERNKTNPRVHSAPCFGDVCVQRASAACGDATNQECVRFNFGRASLSIARQFAAHLRKWFFQRPPRLCLDCFLFHETKSWAFEGLMNVNRCSILESTSNASRFFTSAITASCMLDATEWGCGFEQSACATEIPVSCWRHKSLLD